MKIRTYLLALVLVITGFTTNLQAATTTKTHELTETRVAEIKQRVDQIKAMDVTTLSRSERKNLKSELREMKSELRDGPTYIYISAGALILIIILLILIL